jgi:hypothetical protein
LDEDNIFSTDLSKEWWVTDGPHKCCGESHEKGGKIRKGNQELDGWKESRMKRQREEWKDVCGWIEENDSWELECISDVKRPIHTQTCMHRPTYVTIRPKHKYFRTAIYFMHHTL